MPRSRELAELATSYDSGGSLGFRNRIINGAMVISQRNGTSSITPATGNTYNVDRFLTYSSVTSKFSVQQNAGSVTPPAGFTNYLGITSISAYSVLSGDIFKLSQFIEGFNTADLGWGTANAQTVTLSFWVRSSLTGTFGGAIQNAAENRAYPFTYTISSANTWEQKSITIAGDTTGTWVGATNGIGISVSWGLGVGTTGSGTAGAWSGSAFYSATGATSVVGTNGATFYITGVQLEAGSVATPFERRDYGRELIMCQRYYQKSFDTATLPAASNNGAITIDYGTASTGTLSFPVRLCVSMRAAPTVTLYDEAGTSGVVTRGGNGKSGSADRISTSGFRGISTDATSSSYLSFYFVAAIEL
jgi:hypothetical protein